MSTRAHLSRSEALDEFRVVLIRYREKAVAIVGESGFEARRMRVWLGERQKKFWAQQVRLRQRKVEQARHALFGPRLSGRHGDEPRMALKRAQRDLEHAKERLRRVRSWIRRFPSEVEPLVREMENLETLLVQQLGQWTARLERLMETLEGYAGPGSS